jgi:hypothetical protein
VIQLRFLSQWDWPFAALATYPVPHLHFPPLNCKDSDANIIKIQKQSCVRTQRTEFFVLVLFRFT